MAGNTNISSFLNTKRIYLAIGIGLAIVGLLYWYELTHSSDEISTLNWTIGSFFFLFIGLIMMAFRDLAYMIRLRILTDKTLSWKQTFNVILLWEFASAVSPGVVGGSAVAIFILQREKVPMGKSTALVLVTLIFDNLFYILFIPLVFWSIPHIDLMPAEMSLFADFGLNIFWIGYTIIAVITAVLIYSVFVDTYLIRAIIKGIHKLPFLRKRKTKSVQIIHDIELAKTHFRTKPFRFWLAILMSTIWSWIARFLVINTVLLAFLTLTLPDQIVILGRQFIMWLAMLVTPTPGGSGMAELAFSGMFGDYLQMAGIAAFALALIWRSISYYPYLLIGSILLPRWLRKKQL